MECLDERTVFELVEDELDPAARHEVLAHVRTCQDCREAVEREQRFSGNLTAFWEKVYTDCPAETVLRDYVAQQLPPETHAEVGRHLEVCGRCDETVSVATEWVH